MSGINYENYNVEQIRMITINQIRGVSADIKVLENKLNQYKTMKERVEKAISQLKKAKVNVENGYNMLKINYQSSDARVKNDIERIYEISTGIEGIISILKELIDEPEKKIKEIEEKLRNKKIEKRNLEGHLSQLRLQ